MRKDIEQLMRQAQQLGCEVGHTRSGHWWIKTPSGKTVYAPSTPSDHQSIHHVRRKLRRAGIDLR